MMLDFAKPLQACNVYATVMRSADCQSKNAQKDNVEYEVTNNFSLTSSEGYKESKDILPCVMEGLWS